jgi:hypothetical protein
MSKKDRKKGVKTLEPSNVEDSIEPSFKDAMRDLIGKRWGAVWIPIPVAI